MLISNSINTNSINTNSLSTDTLTTNNITNSDNITTKNLTVSNKLTSNYDLTCYNIFSTNINNVHGITSDYLETNNLTLNNTQLCIYQLSFNVIYNGTASSRGKIMMEFNNIAGLCYDARFDAIELIGCVKEIDNTKFGITNTYKCSVGIDINNLMKCTAYFPPDYTAKVVPIKYIVGTFYSEHSPSSIYPALEEILRGQAQIPIKQNLMIIIYPNFRTGNTVRASYYIISGHKKGRKGIHTQCNLK